MFTKIGIDTINTLTIASWIFYASLIITKRNIINEYPRFVENSVFQQPVS